MNSRLHIGVIIGALSALFASSCVSTSFRPTPNFASRNATPVSPTTVRVFRSAASPPSEPVSVPRGSVDDGVSYIPGGRSPDLRIYRALDPPPNKDLLPLGDIEAYASLSANLETIIRKAR